MSAKRTFEPPAEPGEEKSPAEDFAFERGASGELYGDAAVKPSLYHCAHCDEDILAQDVVWDRSSRPRCPECDSPLKRK